MHGGRSSENLSCVSGLLWKYFFLIIYPALSAGFPQIGQNMGQAMVGKSEKFNPPYKFPKQQGLKFNSEFRFSIPIPHGQFNSPNPISTVTRDTFFSAAYRLTELVF